MRGIVIGSVVTLVLWVLLGWCGVCACRWLECTSFSASALTLVSSLACTAAACIAGVLWVASIGEDQALTEGEFGLATPD